MPLKHCGDNIPAVVTVELGVRVQNMEALLAVGRVFLVVDEADQSSP